MRPWYKYLVMEGESSPYLPIVADFQAASAEMGGYDPDEAYTSKKSFFDRYFQNYHMGRLILYDGFLRRHLSREMEILSVASGRCANELRLIEDGFDILCSDQGMPACAEATRSLFPRWRFEVLDVLAGPAPRKYDAVICLSLIFLFDEAAFARFLRNVADSLRPGGLLLLDSAGGPDNLLSRFIHDWLLPWETRRVARGRRARGERVTVVRKSHGWQRTDAEILSTARAAEFSLVEKWNEAPLIEFRRSRLFNRIVRYGSKLEGVFRRIGRLVPYIRMFALRRKAVESGCA